jgi:hypothetical protein
MIIRKNKVNEELEYLELKEEESLKTLRDNIFSLGKDLGIEISNDIVEKLQGIMNINSYHRNFNREKNILILNKSFTPKVRYLLYKGNVINWFKNLFKIGHRE